MIRLQRFAYLPDATLGRLRVDGELTLWTVENAWHDNRRNESCIPAGSYPLRPRMFNRGGYMTWEVCEVPDRNLILLHRGNESTDVEGCIAVGLDYASAGVWRSRDALDELFRRLPPETGKHHVIVVEDDLIRFSPLNRSSPSSPGS